jgi:hypothetical protein
MLTLQVETNDFKRLINIKSQNKDLSTINEISEMLQVQTFFIIIASRSICQEGEKTQLRLA